MINKYSELGTPHALGLCGVAVAAIMTTGITLSSIYGPPPEPFDPVQRCLTGGSQYEEICEEFFEAAAMMNYGARPSPNLWQVPENYRGPDFYPMPEDD